MRQISGQDVLAWERNARQHGSKINVEQLLATWWLDDVFNRDGRSGGIGTSVMLKAIGACLILEQSTQTAEQNQLLVANQVSIGGIRLRFEGHGQLIGQRPLLRFSFHTLVLSMGGRTLFQRSIPEPDPKRTPFFALIHLDQEQKCLAARGRGGGLAIWRQGQEPE